MEIIAESQRCEIGGNKNTASWGLCVGTSYWLEHFTFHNKGQINNINKISFRGQQISMNQTTLFTW